MNTTRTGTFRVTVFAAALAFVLATVAAEPPKAPATKAPKPLSPAEAAAKLVVPAGFRVSLFAGEPDVAQPIGITFDDRGRLWVAECHTYDDSKINFNMKQHDRIVIFEDTDGDGRFDKRTVFSDKLQKLTSVVVGFGGVWALAAPDLIFIPDANGDDIPDGPPQVVLDGWDGGKVRHNIVNGLKWGPDGWLYGRHGIQATSVIGKPGTPAEQRTKLNCSVWRYHPTQQTFEVVAQGTTNPWGHDWTEHGQLFLINTVIGHLWHIIPGAHYRRMYGEHFKTNTYQLMEQTADHFHWDTGESWGAAKKGVSASTDQAGGGHAHSGLMIYNGDNWPEKYRGQLFTINLHGLRINSDRLERRGNGYVAKHGSDFAKTTDVWFRAVELDYGPDGGVYVADWSDIGECHENDADGVHRETGRIYKITYGTPKFGGAFNLAKQTDAELVKLLTHRNEWFARHAQRLLQERAAAGKLAATTRPAFQKLFEQADNEPHKLRALWALRVTGAVNAATLLDHPSEHVRWWAIQFLCEDKSVTPAVLAKLSALARDGKSSFVRLALASALQKLPVADRWAVAEPLLAHAEDAADPNQSLMIWYGLEPAVAADKARAAQLLAKSQLPEVRKFITRRLTAP